MSRAMTAQPDEQTLPHNLDAEKSVLGAVLVHGDEIFVGDRAQPAAQFVFDAERVDPAVLAHDRHDRLDVVADQVARHFGQFRSMVHDPAQAFRRRRGVKFRAAQARFVLSLCGRCGTQRFIRQRHRQVKAPIEPLCETPREARDFM